MKRDAATSRSIPLKLIKKFPVQDFRKAKIGKNPVFLLTFRMGNGRMRKVSSLGRKGGILWTY